MSTELIKLIFSLMVWGIGEGLFISFIPVYLQQQGVEPDQIGMILSGVAVIMAISHLPAGYLADRIGRRPLLRASWLLGLLACLSMAFAPNLSLFVFGYALYGLTSFVMVPLNSYITTARRNWSVERAITLVYSAFGVGSILGPIFGGLIGNRFGLQKSFLIGTLFFVLSTTIVFFLQSQPIEKQPSSNAVRRLGDLLTRPFREYLLVVFFVVLFIYLPLPLSQNFLRYQRNVNLELIGWLVSIRNLGSVGFNLVLGHFNARKGFFLAQAVMGLAAVLIWAGNRLPWYGLAYLLMGSFQTTRTLATAQGRIMISTANLGLGYGLVETASATASVAAPLLAGFIYQANPTWIYILSLILISLGLVSTLIFYRSHPVPSLSAQEMADDMTV